MSQADSLYRILCDGMPHRSDDLVKKVYGITQGVTLARLGARVYDCKRKYNLAIDSWRDKVNKKLWWYKIAPEQYALPLEFKGGDSMEKGILNGEGSIHPKLGEALRNQSHQGHQENQLGSIA